MEFINNILQLFFFFQKNKKKNQWMTWPLPNMGWSHPQLQPPPQTKGAESTL